MRWLRSSADDAVLDTSQAAGDQADWPALPAGGRRPASPRQHRGWHQLRQDGRRQDRSRLPTQPSLHRNLDRRRYFLRPTRRYGLAFLPPDHRSYRARQYWRPRCGRKVMADQSALRWGREDLCEVNSRASLRSVLTSGFGGKGRRRSWAPTPTSAPERSTDDTAPPTPGSGTSSAMRATPVFPTRTSDIGRGLASLTST
jgi:hypothetical protein